MHEFGSIDSFVHFIETTVKLRLAAMPALEKAAIMVEKAAKAEIGTYQRTNMGPFAAWEELSPYTKEERVKGGFTENDPLLRSGSLRDSINYTISADGKEAVIGSSDIRLVYLELGTKYMAPRSVLGLAAWRKRKQIVKLVGGMTVAALLGVDFSSYGSFIMSHIREAD
jgi:hypothetical protein